MGRPLVSFISVAYDHLADTVAFLESAQQLTYPSVQIIIVDNNSPKEKITTEVKKRFPHVTFVESNVNRGFAGGNNLGIKEATGEYLFLLNNDTLLPPSFLEPIIDLMESNPRIGIASPKVMYPDMKTIQYAGAISPSPITGRGKRIGLFEQDHGQYNRNYKTDLGHGAALIVRREAANMVGPMPEVYFLYYEEHDWTEQIKRKGFEMHYIGTSHIVHKESVSTGGEESPLKVYYLTRNRILYMRRNSGGLNFALGMLFFTFIASPKSLLKYVLGRKPQLASAFLKGVFWNLTGAKE